MKIRVIGVVLALCTASIPAFPATKSEIMFSRYFRHLTCMQNTLGRDEYNGKLGLVFAMNRWGVSEPTGRSIATASEKVKTADAKCRADNNLEDEPRP